jgi:hypothetical protein
MSDSKEAVSTAPSSMKPVGETKRDKIEAIWSQWRNKHINNIDVHSFRTVEAASRHLIDELAAVL